MVTEQKDFIKDFVWGRIERLTNLGDSPEGKAALAKLRRGVGKAPGAIPGLWRLTLEGLPSECYSKDGKPTRGEWAAYTALTLYALHQQSSSPKEQPMSVSGMGLGTAVRRLVHSEEDEPRVKRRFDAVVTAGDVFELTHHLRGLVQILKSDGIPLDYPALARDIYWFLNQSTRDRIRLKWGREYYRLRTENTETASQG